MYHVHSLSRRNRVNSPSAATVRYSGMSKALGLSSKDGFGRPCPATAPFGQSSVGSSSILESDGLPLKGVPNPLIGVVYKGLSCPLPSLRTAGSDQHRSRGVSFIPDEVMRHPTEDSRCQITR